MSTDPRDGANVDDVSGEVTFSIKCNIGRLIGRGGETLRWLKSVTSCSSINVETTGKDIANVTLKASSDAALREAESLIKYRCAIVEREKTYQTTPGQLIGPLGCNIEQVKVASGKCVLMDVANDSGMAHVTFSGPLYNVEQAIAEYDKIFAEHCARKELRKEKRIEIELEKNDCMKFRANRDQKYHIKYETDDY